MLKTLGTLWDTGVRLRCPVCEQGTLFKDAFTMHSVCPHCSVRFERNDGEVVGAMNVSIVVTAAIFLVGLMVTEMLWDWSAPLHLAIWVPFAILFPIAFYRYSRALWVAFLYLIGDVFWDKEPYQGTDLTLMDAFLNRPASPAEPAAPAAPSPPAPPEDDDDRLPRQRPKPR